MPVKTIKNTKKPRIVLYGTEGIGKTTLCANPALKPLFLFTEDGIGSLQVDAMEDDYDNYVIKDFKTFKEHLEYIRLNDIPNRTLVIDSLDWLEKLIHEETAGLENKSHVGEIAFGKGYSRAAGEMADILNRLDAIRSEKDMMIVLIAHSKVSRFESPESDSFDRYTLDIHDKANSIVREWADCIFFATQQVTVKKTSGDFGKVEKRGIGDGKRIIYTQERPAFQAKNRFDLDAEQPFDLVEIVKQIFTR